MTTNRHIIYYLALLAIPLSVTAEELRPDERGVASGAYNNSDKVWYINGIWGRWLAVGQPNMWNRRDRVEFRFPIMKFLPRNHIEKATLRFEYNSGGEIKRTHIIETEHFTTERIQLSGKDLLSSATTPVHEMAVPPDSPRTQVEFDVTEVVRADIAKGFEFTAFRIRSRTADEIGNPEKKSSYVTIEQGSMVLSIMP